MARSNPFTPSGLTRELRAGGFPWVDDNGQLVNADGSVVNSGGSPVVFTGTLGVGQVITASPNSSSAGSWTFTSGQWYADGVAISGATTLGYTQLVGDVGKTLTFVPTGVPFRGTAGVVPSGGVAPALRAISTNTNFPNNYSTTYKQMMTRRRHIIQVRVTGVALRLVGAYVDPTTWTELGSGAATTVTATIERGGVNLGAFKQGGNATITVPDLGQVDTDILPVDLFPGDIVYTREYKTNANGIMYEGNNVSGTRPGYNDLNNGEGCYAAASGIADTTAGTGALTGGTNVTTAMGGPYALIGYHNGKAVCVLGDSIEVGIGETFHPSYGRGITHVAIAALGLPVVKTAQGGDGATKFTASNARRRAAMAGIFTNIICNYVFNDIVNFSRTGAQVAADHTTIAGYFAGVTYDVRTCSPYSSSTDSYATTANQTPQAAGANLNTTNNLLRGLPPGVRMCFETSDAMGTGRNTNIWKADGIVGNRRTADGVHPTRISGDDVLSAQVFQLSAFA